MPAASLVFVVFIIRHIFVIDLIIEIVFLFVKRDNPISLFFRRREYLFRLSFLG